MPHNTDQMSTGQAARLLSVTADTVLKWIKKGKLPATRTAGGHYRVLWADVQGLREHGHPAGEPGRTVFCWQFHGESDEVSSTCASCVVYRARAERCFVLSGQAIDSHPGTHCATSCLDCAYYLGHFQDRIGVLVVLDDDAKRASLEKEIAPSGLDVAFSRNVYQTAIQMQEFRPTYVVLHCSLDPARCSDLKKDIEADLRVPGVRVLLATDAAIDPAPDLPRAFTMGDLQRAVWEVHRTRVNPA